MSSPAGAQLFRKSALDRLASPEQLDQLVTVTGPRGWLALAAAALLVAGALAWSVLGSVATRVGGEGILVATGGQVFDAAAAARGNLVDQGVRPGDPVRAGQVLALIAQPDLELRLAGARVQAEELARELEERRADAGRAAAARRANNAGRRAALERSIAAAGERERAYEEIVRGLEGLARTGNTTRQRLEEGRQSLAEARQSAADARAQLLEIEAAEIAAEAAASREIADARQRAGDARRSADQLALQLERFGRVASPADGRLIEWKAAFGTFIEPGTLVASVESGARGLQFVLYVPPDKGKQVTPGMEAHIQPNGIRKEEWGTLAGRVVSVSSFPSTRQGMLATLQNETLVDHFAARGAPFAARVDLLPDPSTPSGYRWSGGQGPPSVLTSGMLAEVEVTVRRQAPISLVLPFLRGASGL
jgi:HlyD family secretion protein